jgi:RHS repeat-associated protein
VADGLNRNATVAGVTQTYDRFGNLTSDGTRTFTYDSENRLLTESGPVTLALSYDPMGRLQQSVINGTTTQFLYDDDALVGEYPATGNTPLRRYVQGVGTDNPLIWYEGGTMTAANANYLLTDRQGSIVGTGNSSGALTVNYTYDAHGAPNTWGTVGTVPRFRYTGQAAIPEAKLYHYKARVYDPVSGRFLQTDPVGYGPDVNWYVYVHNDPVNRTDPTGKDWISDLFGAVGNFFNQIVNPPPPPPAPTATPQGGTTVSEVVVTAKSRSTPPPPDPNAEGRPHSTVQRPGPQGRYTTYDEHGPVKQYRGEPAPGEPNGQPRPNVKEWPRNTAPNGRTYPGSPTVRQPTPDEIPGGGPVAPEPVVPEIPEIPIIEIPL